MEGWLFKKGEKGLVKTWKHRYFRQHKDQLMYFRSDTTQESLGAIPLSEVYAVHPCEMKDKEHTFQISTEQRIFYLHADTEDILNYWILGLSAFIKRAGTQDRLVLKQIEEREKGQREKEQQEKQRKANSIPKRSAIKPEHTKEKATIRKTSNSEKFLAIPELVVPAKPLPSPPKSLPRSMNQSVSKEDSKSSMEGPLQLKPQNRNENPALGSPCSPSGSPRALPSPPGSQTCKEKKSSSDDDVEDSHSDIENTSESKRSIIGKSVIVASTPSRKPPPPPEDGDDSLPSIRVAGFVSPVVSEKRERPTTWITRTEPIGRGHSTQFLHTRSGSALFPENDDASHRTKLVREVISSEESYVASLNTLVHHYLHPLRNHTDKRVSKEINGIFGNVEQILQLNTDLLNRLKDRITKWSDTQVFGDIFIQVAPYLKLYAKYGTNYEVAINLYQKEMKENPTFRDAVELRNLEAGTSVHLHHLLIMPIQRIPRYNMLLTDIIKNTDPSHPDYENLTTALQSTKQVATHLNESVRESEMERTLNDLAERLEITLLLAPHRRLLREGSFRIIVGKKEKRNLHHLILFNDILVCISRSKIRKPSEFMHPRNNYPLSLVWFKECKHEKLKCIRVINPTYTFLVIFDSQEELMAWKNVLTNGIQNILKNQPANEDPSLVEEENQLPSMRQGSFMYPGGSSYTGWFLNGQKQGPGEFWFSSCHYCGSFVQNKMSGTGKITYPSGEMYSGCWENNLPHGDGTFGSPKGDVYDGHFVNGKKEGQGKYNYSNGDHYEGCWQQDLPHGVGKFYYSTGKRYEGEWIKGQRSGVGSMDYGNGASYEGSWLQDKWHGHGTYVLPDGSYYEGDFIHGLYDGTGVIVYKDGRKYSGQWRAGKPNGTGTFTSAVGSISLLEAEWFNGTVQGKGNIKFANGDSFTGYFRDNWIHGTGTFNHANMIIEGRWNTGQLEGKITIHFEENEQILSGMVVNGTSVHSGDDYAPPLMLPYLPSFFSIEF